MALTPGQRVTAMRYLATRTECVYVGPAPDLRVRPNLGSGQSPPIRQAFVRFDDGVTEAVRLDTLESVETS